MVSVQIPEEVYLAGLEDCKNHLHGRLILNKGDKPVKHLELCKKLSAMCSSLAEWKAIGFF